MNMKDFKRRVGDMKKFFTTYEEIRQSYPEGPKLGNFISQGDAINLFLEEYPYPLDDMYGHEFEQWDELDEFMNEHDYVWDADANAYVKNDI